ncbi:MAG: anaerobic ribonucleoside-triphosphate reductase activating protein [Erysipelotrichia bacterium]|nr:anaerobic ribonucleoside-triphosphate reductase activating protein [Erysipelotrichia bacterium]NCC55064.1 anaerobic ribonucleoside-triphosphate reductase activating protein [Erysipelotrichia bacterium]
MRYHNITKDDMLNGDGLRAVLWLSGCEHACPNCHNPITWDIEGGLKFDLKAKNELFDLLERDYIAGVTLSGGDPLHPKNIQEVSELVEEIKESFPTKTIWLYTGYQWDEIKGLPLIKNLDVLVDGEFIQALKDEKLHWKGSSNQNVIDVQASLKQGQIVLHD